MRRANSMHISTVTVVVALLALGSLVLAAGASAAPPSIESESVSNLTSTDATLEAEINLREAPAGVHYQFQLVTDASKYASEILCPPTLQPGYSGCIGPQGPGALPIGFLPGNTMQPGATLRASLDLASSGVTLQPGTTYHYRVLVARAVQTEDTIEWEPPTVYGADQTFTTPSAGTPPMIEGESVSHITQTDATLEAKINTEGLETTYEFQLFERWWCEELTPGCLPPIRVFPLPTGKILGSFVAQSVSLDLNSGGVSLSPGHNFYEYAVTATNAAGTTQGQPQTFITPSDPPPTDAQTTSTVGLPAAQSPPNGFRSNPRMHRHRKHKRRHQIRPHVSKAHQRGR